MKAFDEVILILGQLESAWKEIFHASEGPRFIHDTGHENPAALRATGAY
jgi:flagellin-specific chaperone FliS